MSETQAAGFKNPYDVDNMIEGGGLTREGVVIAAKYVASPMTTRDGAPWVDPKTGKPGFFTGLRLTVLRTGDPRFEGKEEKYEYSSGKKGKPSADGELLLDEKGAPLMVHKTSNLGKALVRLKDGGFDTRMLYPRVSALVGARVVFEGVQKVDAAGKPKTHVYQDKVYTDFDWYPSEYKGGAGSAAAGSPAGAAPNALEAKAEAAVVAALTEAGGAMDRKDVIRALGTSLKGDPEAIKVTALVARQDFHEGRPWSFDGTRLALGAK